MEIHPRIGGILPIDTVRIHLPIASVECRAEIVAVEPKSSIENLGLPNRIERTTISLSYPRTID